MAGDGLPLIERYRCTTCGNLTRFDVVERRLTRSYYHFTLGGELTIEQSDDLEHRVEEVICRWCQTGNAVVTVDTAEQEGALTEASDRMTEGTE